MAEREIYNEQTGQYEFADDDRVDTPYTLPPPVKTAAEIEEERRRYNQQHPPKQRTGYQNVWNDRTGEWEEHSTTPEVPDDPAGRPPGSPQPPPPAAAASASGWQDASPDRSRGPRLRQSQWAHRRLHVVKRSVGEWITE